MALARAGGGQHFGGGGGGFGGGGGSGLFGLWPLLFFGHGSSFTTIIVILIIYYLYQQMQARRAQPWSPGGPETGYVPAQTQNPPAAVDPQAVASGLADLKAKDPNFDERAFLDRAQTSFFKVQKAWAARNQDLARDVMSDELYERHKMQTDQLLASHQVDVLENVVVGSARLIDAHIGKPYDSITVAFTASMTDYTVDEQSKNIVSGTKYPQTFTELWTFIRRSDAKSQAGQTSLGSTCPSCGAPLTVRDGKCDYCGAYIRTASSDWVVDTIEQAA